MSERTVEWCVEHDAPRSATDWNGKDFCQLVFGWQMPTCRFVTASVLVPDEEER